MSPMEKNEFIAYLATMCAYYGKESRDEFIWIYWDDLRAYRLQDIKNAFADFRSDPKRKHYFPTVAEIRDKIPKVSQQVSSKRGCMVFDCVSISNLQNEGIQKDGTPWMVCPKHGDDYRFAEQVAKYHNELHYMTHLRNFEATDDDRVQGYIRHWKRYYGVRNEAVPTELV